MLSLRRKLHAQKEVISLPKNPKNFLLCTSWENLFNGKSGNSHQYNTVLLSLHHLPTVRFHLSEIPLCLISWRQGKENMCLPNFVHEVKVFMLGGSYSQTSFIFKLKKIISQMIQSRSLRHSHVSFGSVCSSQSLSAVHKARGAGPLKPDA